jgi:hypothetical protein
MSMATPAPAKKGLSGHAVLAAIVRGLETLPDLSVALQAPRANVSLAAARLKKRGFVSSPVKGVYQATEAGRAFIGQGHEIRSGQSATRHRPYTRGLRQRAWWVIRARQIVSLQDLLCSLCEGTEKAPDNNLFKYLRALTQAGYLQCVPGEPRRWRLIRDTGRLSPVTRSGKGKKSVFDPNTGREIDISEAP